jgi:arsenate reductase
VTVTIYHDPGCATSRDVLALIRNSGVEPHIIEYLKAPPSREELAELLRRMDLPPRAVLRRKGTPYDELGLDDPSWDDDRLLELMLRRPVLVDRPIVATPLGVRLCRPSETVLNILPDPQGGAFRKESGEPVIDNLGRRVDKGALD